MNNCYFCGNKSEDKIYRTSLCSSCGKDLKICFNCQHFDKNSSHQCREPQAERVADKDRANFCDYFTPSGKNAVSDQLKKSEDARKSLEDLFS